jgi:hypothetical protein
MRWISFPLWPGSAAKTGTLHTYIGRLRAALTPYGVGIELWRGETDDAGLTELRLDTAERYARLLLDSGEHEDAAKLVAVAGTERERLCAYVMTALHRCGRRADALDLHERTRRSLAELDLTPGPELTALRDRVERGDPELLRPAAPRYAVHVRGQWMPWQTAGHPALEFCNTFAGWGRPVTPRSE